MVDAKLSAISTYREMRFHFFGTLDKIYTNGKKMGKCQGDFTLWNICNKDTIHILHLSETLLLT